MNNLWLRVCARFNRSSADTLQNTFAKKETVVCFPKKEKFPSNWPEAPLFYCTKPSQLCFVPPPNTSNGWEKKISKEKKGKPHGFQLQFQIQPYKSSNTLMWRSEESGGSSLSVIIRFSHHSSHISQRERERRQCSGVRQQDGGKVGALQPKEKADKKVQWSQSHIISKAIFHTYGNLRESFWLCCCSSSGSPAAPSSAVQPTRRKKNNDFTSSASKSAFQKQAIKNIHVFLWCAIMLLIPHQQYAQQTHAWWRIRSISECWWFPCH